METGAAAAKDEARVKVSPWVEWWQVSSMEACPVGTIPFSKTEGFSSLAVGIQNGVLFMAVNPGYCFTRHRSPALTIPLVGSYV